MSVAFAGALIGGVLPRSLYVNLRVSPLVRSTSWNGSVAARDHPQLHRGIAWPAQAMAEDRPHEQVVGRLEQGVRVDARVRNRAGVNGRAFRLRRLFDPRDEREDLVGCVARNVVPGHSHPRGDHRGDVVRVRVVQPRAVGLLHIDAAVDDQELLQRAEHLAARRSRPLQQFLIVDGGVYVQIRRLVAALRGRGQRPRGGSAREGANGPEQRCGNAADRAASRRSNRRQIRKARTVYTARFEHERRPGHPARAVRRPAHGVGDPQPSPGRARRSHDAAADDHRQRRNRSRRWTFTRGDTLKFTYSDLGSTPPITAPAKATDMGAERGAAVGGGEVPAPPQLRSKSYSPFHSGARFSRKAPMPSCASPASEFAAITDLVRS